MSAETKPLQFWEAVKLRSQGKPVLCSVCADKPDWFVLAPDLDEFWAQPLTHLEQCSWRPVCDWVPCKWWQAVEWMQKNPKGWAQYRNWPSEKWIDVKIQDIVLDADEFIAEWRIPA